jgi:pantetheine-phosphate adenylyltransferase/dephospho-CoA kinase
MVKAMYAFSGDPITYGHMDVVERSAKAFDQVVVGIGVNPNKKYTFSLEERTEMARRALANFPNVETVSFPGLLVDYAYENGIGVIVKGVRNSADFEYENILHQIGESQKKGVETFVLPARPELAHISSSAVKAIQGEQGMIEGYVPLHVKQALEERISGQYIVGVSGEIGSGKSYVSQKFVELGGAQGIEVHDIELDHIGHQILGELKEPRYAEVRKQVADTFGRALMKGDGTIDRKGLGEIVFNDPTALVELNGIMRDPLLVRLRREMYGKKGMILFNAALIAESDMAYLCNNNVVLVYVDKDTQQARLEGRNLDPEQVRRRLASQYDFQEKKDKLGGAIERDSQGTIWTMDNSGDGADIEKTFQEINSVLGIK